MAQEVVKSPPLEGGMRHHFDKNLIREIVKAVERGCSRSDVIKRYGMAKSTLADWVREYASPAYHASRKPLPAPQRRSLVRAVVEDGMTLQEAKLAYQLPSTAAVTRYLVLAEKEKAELRRIALLMPINETRSEAISSDDAAALKKALEEAELKIKALNTLIDVAEEKFKIDIRKKPGAKQCCE